MLYSIMFWVLVVIAGLAVLAIAFAALEKLGLMDLGEDSEPFNASQFISTSIAAILFAAGAGWAYTAKKENASDEPGDIVALQEQKNNEAAVAEKPAEPGGLDKVWSAYTNYPGNVDPDTSYVDVKGKMIERGTVPPSAVNSSAKERLPAYLACYDYVLVISGAGDVETDLCIYFIDNPSRGTYAVMWRGKNLMATLKSKMVDDGFVSN